MAASTIPWSIQYPRGTPPFLASTTKSFASIAPQVSNGKYTANPSSSAFNPAPYTLNPGLAASNPDQASADLVRKQSSYFQNRGAPLEDAALADITDPNLPRRLATQAGQSASEAIDATAGMERRNLGRFGVRVTADKQRSLDRNFGLERALAVSGAENQAYSGGQDTQIQLSSDALQIGRGIAGQASRDISSAGSLATARQAAARQAASAQSASRVSAAAGGAGLGFMAGTSSAMMGAKFGAAAGPVGAAVGAGIGLLASFLG
jgi:hypothetical protein